jgi:protein-tyrosine kinase
MNAQPLYAETPLESDQEISDALVLLYKLPDEALDSIHESRRTLGLSFVEAALHTGLVSQHELEEAQDWARRQSLPGSRSIVEEALRRRSNTREVVVWEGERLVPGKELVLAHDPYGVRSEAIRSLRTELLMRTNSRRGAAIFAFVSAAGGEGRSQLCAELALAFAQLGSRTLLVDADMRSPRQHLLFGADNQIGLAQALAEGGSGRAYRVDRPPARLRQIRLSCCRDRDSKRWLRNGAGHMNSY